MAGRKIRRSDQLMGTSRSRKSKTTIAICCCAGAVVIALVLFFFVLGGLRTDADKEKWLAEGTYMEGVSVDGINLSGMTLTQASETILPVAQSKIENLKVSYTVLGSTYSLSGKELGASIDFQSTLKEALLYGKTGNFFNRTAQSSEAKKSGVNFPLKISLNESSVKEAVDKKGAEYNVQPQSASLKVDTSNVGSWDDRSTLTTTGKVEITKPVEGKTVDADKLTSDIMAAAQNDTLSNVIETSVNITQPEENKETPSDMVLMASATTYFEDSKSGRRYNIWKMSTVVNGVVLKPGETWSINDAAGPRTTETGWDSAAGIRDGSYVDEPGGGICQVSSTLYNALLKAEVEIVDRSHHSWPLGYVKTGLDATISTGSPDFVFKNNYNVPIAIVVNCDAVNSRKLTVSVYGPSRDYAVKLESNIVSETEPTDEMQIIYDSSMNEGETQIVKKRHNKIVVDIYKIKYNPDTEEELSREKLYTDTYRAFAGQKKVGTKTTAPSQPEPTTEPSASPSVQPSPSPDASPSSEA